MNRTTRTYMSFSFVDVPRSAVARGSGDGSRLVQSPADLIALQNARSPTTWKFEGPESGRESGWGRYLLDSKASFGLGASKRYDAEDTRGDEEETVAFLARLAGGRDALELAVGTGRIALPLSRAGVRVDGIELSQHTSTGCARNRAVATSK